MKILIVSPYFPPHIGGAENYAYQIAKGLLSKKHDVVIVTSNHYKENGYRTDKVDMMKVYRLPIWFTLSKSPFNLFWFFDILKLIRKEKPDVIYANTPVPFLADFSVLAAKLLKIPFVLMYHNDLIKDDSGLSVALSIYYGTIGKLLLSLSDKIITTSDYYLTQSPYLRSFTIKTEIVPPGILLEQFTQKSTMPEQLKKLQTKKIVLFVGTMDIWHSHKGVPFLLEAIAELLPQVPDIQLIAVGKGNNIPSFKKMAKALSIDSSVLFTDFVPNDELLSYYKEADVIVLPSTNNSEGFGMILLEAGAVSKPIIATNVGGVPAVLKALKSGFLVEPKNSRDLADAIKKVVTNPKLAKQLGENGYKKVVGQYQWKHQIDKTEVVLKKLI